MLIDLSLEAGQVLLEIDTDASTVKVSNGDPTMAAVFNVFNDVTLDGQPAGSTLVFSYSQAPGTSTTNPVPTTDQNGNPINWQVGTVTTKGGAQVQAITNPPFQITMQ